VSLDPAKLAGVFVLSSSAYPAGVARQTPRKCCGPLVSVSNRLNLVLWRATLQPLFSL
jgi:hypothetical protein